MPQLPELLRTETWHPLIVHFPIVLLLVSTAFKLLFIIDKRETWDHGGSLLLYAGTIAAWIAVYTGSLADAVVVRDLCDPVVLESHENMAYLLSTLFTVASVLDILWRFIPKLKIVTIQVITVIVMVSGAAVLSYTGHLGASLVYQQAAGVYVPSESCEEFVK